MEYRVIRDMCFHNNEEQKFFTIKKGSVYSEVTENNQSMKIKDTLRHRKKMAKNPNDQFVVLLAEGKERSFQIQKDVVPHQKRRIRRIQRWKS